MENFNSRPSARGDGGSNGDDTAQDLYFNSRPSARGDVLLNRAAISRLYFNSRPSARGDKFEAHYYVTSVISIHAPPRGATRILSGRFSVLLFQFTPLREGRPAHSARSAASWNFNSRPSARGDAFQYIMRIIGEISIHAPPRGATFLSISQALCVYFNSRPSARGDI